MTQGSCGSHPLALGELLELMGVSLARTSWRGCLSPCHIHVEDVAPLMLDDRGRTPTHTEGALGNRVVVSSDKGYTGYHEVLEAQPPHTTVVLCCSESHHPWEWHQGLCGGLKLWGTNGTGHGAARILSAMGRTGTQPGLGVRGCSPLRWPHNEVAVGTAGTHVAAAVPEPGACVWQWVM